MVLRIVEQVVDQRTAIIVVDRAVSEHEALEAGEYGLAEGPVMVTVLPERVTVASISRKPNVIVSTPVLPSSCRLPFAVKLLSPGDASTKSSALRLPRTTCAG